MDTDSIDSIINDLKNHDFVFIALHGTFGEDGVIQSILSKNNIPFNGSNEDSSRNCFNKSVTKEIVMSQGVLSPNYYQTSSIHKEVQLVLILSISLKIWMMP